jgi:phage tail-like protein
MNNEFEFRVLTREDWGKGTRDGLKIREDGGLELEDRDGSYTSEPLDSGIVGCRWHRIVLDADIPENSTLTVSFYSTENKEGAETWSEPIVFKKSVGDALVQAPPGRYIKLKIDFHREAGEESPVLKQVMLYYPRLSYLRYLPAVYQEESASKEFLERFLSIFESALHDSEETISRIPRYFDPMATQDEFVPWLASWLSLDLYELLELEDKNREFILRAVEFYKQKGTVSGT